MKRSSEYNFSVPNRQSNVAILIILGKSIYTIFRQILPLLFVVLVGSSKSKGDNILYIIIGVAVISAIYSILNFYKTYFIVEKKELVLYTGIFQKSKKSIPFSKIQTINFEQNLVHQLFSVLQVNIDTAGSEQEEFSLKALDKNKANALRELLLLEKKAVTSNSSVESTILGPEVVGNYKKIMNLSISDLLKVGFTQNHLKSVGVIIAFGFWVVQSLDEVGMPFSPYDSGLVDMDWKVSLIIFVATLFILISIMISVSSTIIRYYDLHFLRSTNGFKVISGLFTRRETSALDHKIQRVSWSDNLLKRIIGYKNLFLRQASSDVVTTSQSIFIPGCTMHHIHSVIESLFGNVNLSEMPRKPIDKAYFTRFATICAILLAAIWLAGLWFDLVLRLLIPTAIIALIVFGRYLSFRKKRYGFNSELIFIEGGVYGQKVELFPIYKLQALEISQSPYQVRKKLASLQLHTASGLVKIPYIDITDAIHMNDVFLAKLENDRRKWM